MPLPEGLLAAIPGDNPCGADLYYSPVFDKIREARAAAIKKEFPEDVPHDLSRVDFGKVIGLCTDALTNQTKDLFIASWLTEALLAKQGFSGLTEGLDLLRAYVETWWDHVYPQPEEGDLDRRAAPLTWLGNYLEPHKQTSPAFIAQLVPLTATRLNWIQRGEAKQSPKPEGGDDGGDTAASDVFTTGIEQTPKQFYKDRNAELTAALRAVDALDKACDERFKDAAPSFGLLKRVLAEIASFVGFTLAEKLRIDPDPVEVAPEAESDGSGAGTATALALEPLTGEMNTRDHAVQYVIAAARKMRQENPKDPSPYLVVRAVRFGELRAAGTTVDPRLLISPSPDIRTRIRKLALDEKWGPLLMAVEEAAGLPCGRGWLDLQRYAVSACEHLGDEYAPVASAIRGALRDYLGCFPELPQMSLMDDTPAANAQTQQWINEHVAPGPSLRQILSAAPGAPANGASELYDAALESAQAGRHAEALAMLSRYAPANSGRARFLHKVQLAQVLMAAGRARVAQPILTELAQEIDERRLEQWEAPDLVARVLALQYHCLKELDIESDTRDRIQQKLCLLDPMAALGCAE
jgi:type VI secretion system protein ImpA